MRRTVEVFAPAKLTLSLRITGVRADGYHKIDAEMTTIDFGDWLEIVPDGHGVEMTYMGGGEAPGLGLGVDDDLVSEAAGRVLGVGDNLVSEAAGRGLGVGGDFVSEAPRRGLSVDDNLVTKALRLAGRRARVTVKKQIPICSGLGGGSADAAAVLRWAEFRDPEKAATIGADVAFCLVGGRARVRGIGEQIEARPYKREQFTLLIPPLECSTRAVYRAWDEMGGPVGPSGNDLEPAALRVTPGIAEWRDRLGNDSGLTPRLAGSGSTWFVPGAFPGQGRAVVTTWPE